MPVSIFNPKEHELLMVRGETSFLVAGQACSRFSLCIETQSDEYCQAVWPHHLIAVSAPEGGSVLAALMLFCLVRDHHVPLLVLPKDHPGSRRLRYVVSAGEKILLSCTIARGTHPEQDILCSSTELGGILLEGYLSGIHVSNIPPGVEAGVISLPETLVETSGDPWSAGSGK